MGGSSSSSSGKNIKRGSSKSSNKVKLSAFWKGDSILGIGDLLGKRVLEDLHEICKLEVPLEIGGLDDPLEARNFLLFAIRLLRAGLFLGIFLDLGLVMLDSEWLISQCVTCLRNKILMGTDDSMWSVVGCVHYPQAKQIPLGGEMRVRKHPLAEHPCDIGMYNDFGNQIGNTKIWIFVSMLITCFFIL